MKKRSARSQTVERAEWIYRLLPFLLWWPHVTRKTLRADLVAGLTGSVVALPQGVAFATIAGMPPEYGLYTGMIPAIIAALFGSSWLLVSGPTTAASIVLFSSLSLHATPGSPEYIQLALTLTLMVGLIQLSMGLVRFGSLVNFISHSVIVGFTAGAALLIIASQLKHFFGLTYPRAVNFQDSIYNFLLHIKEINPYTTTVALLTIIAGVLVKKYRPSWPYMIVSMLVGSVVAAVIISLFGKETAAIATVGALPATLPPLSLPHLTMGNIKLLAPTALAMTLFALTEAVSIARSLADKTDQNLDGNQEFIGQGLSNIIGPFFSGYVATGSFNRSGMNYEAGAKTPLAAIFAGMLLVLAVLFIAPMATYLPNSAMAAILFLVAWKLIDPHHIIKIVKTSKTETVILGSTFLATLFLELQFAIMLGIMLSLAIYLNRTSHPKTLVRVPDPRQESRAFITDPMLPECPQLKIIRIDGSLYFGAVNHVRNNLQQLMQAKPEQKNLLLIGSGINFIDMAGAELLLQLVKEREAAGGHLYFYDMKEGICNHFKFLQYLLDIGTDNIFVSKTEAISEIFTRLDRSICNNCSSKIFLECSSTAVGSAAFVCSNTDKVPE
ncbi:SulP family inorganic anion transporter [Desulforhopalus sp. IMCC35007]|uniref:SulP family inorganic anion transporter n=1 Tax=Desulforhopalus sp. IMCC35007 TaxID=2569543 RepID=UPI0010ADEC71|nr:SulP family inorganic anion transporter [Desulforhopalus sp. IMCC35007]TKB10404.1 SulP family inorganic anion transporter [Desulforhopalus sp. IMCC35007]